MRPQDKINKASWTLTESIKDSVSNNVTAMVTGGQLKIETKSLQLLLVLLNSSVEEGYHKASKVFSKTVDAAIQELLVQQQPVVSKKK